MQSPAPQSIWESLWTFFSTMFLLGLLNTSQFLPGSATRHHSSLSPVEDPDRETLGSSSPPSMQTYSGDLDRTMPDDGAPSSSPPSPPTKNHGNSRNITSLASGSSFPSEIYSSPPVKETHNSPHMETCGGEPSNSDPISGSHSSSYPPSAESRSIPATSTSTNLLSGAHNFVMNHPVFHVKEGLNTVTQGMKSLCERVLEGAEYDSSLRDPPPQCHPGTRVQLMQKILTWFRDARRERALLWLNGPAGVGKSAVMQTVAESLAASNSIGATLFFSRLNERNDPQRVFITIAFQLATRIPAYQLYITERIALDPSLLRKNMKDQFRIFITEPFGNNGIGKGEGPWVVVLDGLDECQGVGEQSRIVRLISEFVLKFSNAPLIWAIASRPEPHIKVTFNDEAVTSSYWSEYVPIDSTQACQDVERYLDASFKALRTQFPHLPSYWPPESQFLKLSNGAQGLFVFARTAVRFMEDPDYADPVSRLNLILSIIDRLDIKDIDDHPFALLDALYTQILVSIPSSVWCTTKRLLGFVICARRTQERGIHQKLSSRFGDGLSYPLHSGSRSLMGASFILGLEVSVAYGSLHKLHSVLVIPDSTYAHKSGVKFLHASFGDYLTDQSRSKDFYIDRGESVDNISRCIFQLYLDKPWRTGWERYGSQLSRVPPFKFYKELGEDIKQSPEYVLTGGLQSQRGRGPFKSQQDRSDCLAALSQINLAEAYEFVFHDTLATLLIELWNTFREELESTGRFKEVSLRDLKVDHLNYLDYDVNTPVFVRKDTDPTGTFLMGIKAELEAHLKLHPERLAMIYGSLPENRIAFFVGEYYGSEGYYCFPYPY